MDNTGYKRYLGLPVMLKAGEYSPNNPLIRSERPAGDALLGLGEYERRRNTLRKIRQQQYREYLDQQAKKKQEAKEQAEKERREREEREREREEREKEIERLERDRSPELRRASYCYTTDVASNGTSSSTNKVDTAVQVNTRSPGRPLSVAVQTDEADLFPLGPVPLKALLTEAERELSPRTVMDPYQGSSIPSATEPEAAWKSAGARRRSYGDFYDYSSTKKASRGRLGSESRYTYMPSIFDADAIHLRNLQAEKEAAERRQFYQQELKNQILEQQRIREERKAREKMLEQAEMRRLEEQLRMLQVAQDRELDLQRDITAKSVANATEYDKKRTSLQKEIDLEQQALLRVVSRTSKSPHEKYPRFPPEDHNKPSKLPFYYPKVTDEVKEVYDYETRKPYSFNIPDNSIFSPNYDVESYLRRNLNPASDKHLNRLESVKNDVFAKDIDNLEVKNNRYNFASKFKNNERIGKVENTVKDKLPDQNKEKKVEPLHHDMDSLPIPVLKHSPRIVEDIDDKNGAKLSEAMKKVDDKWKVPAVQKNILKSLNEEGKNVSILTQLGSIRRQLQLEQLKLDNLLYSDDQI